MVIEKDKIKKIAFSLAEAMISMLIISAIATMSIKLFAGQKTKKAADMAHHIMGCYLTDAGEIVSMSMDIGDADSLKTECLGALSSNNGHCSGVGEGAEAGQIPDIKIFNYNWGGGYYGESASSDFNYPINDAALQIPNNAGGDKIKGPFCAIDVTESLGSTAKTLVMIGGGGFGYMSSNSLYALYNRPGDTGFFSTYTNVDFSRPGIYRFYPGAGAKPSSGNDERQALGDSSNEQGGPSRLVYIPSTRDAQGRIIENFTSTVNKNGRNVVVSNVEVLAEARGGYSRNHYYPLGGISLTEVGCDDSESCQFNGAENELRIAARESSAFSKLYCTGTNSDVTKCAERQASSNWHKYKTPGAFFGATEAVADSKYKNYVTKTVYSGDNANSVVSYFAGKNGSSNFDSYYMGGTMIATAAGNRITIGMNDLAPRCTNEMYDFLRLTANAASGNTLFTGENDPFLYTFGTGGACSNYHNLTPGTGGIAGKGGAIFIIW